MVGKHPQNTKSLYVLEKTLADNQGFTAGGPYIGFYVCAPRTEGNIPVILVVVDQPERGKL